MKGSIKILTTAVVLVGALLSVPASDAAGTAGTSGHQRFVLITANTSSMGGPIAANGVIHAKGKDVVLKGNRDRFVFPQGNVIIRHHATKGTRHQSFDRTTCLFTYSERGTWRAISGNRAYSNVSGHGTYRVLSQGFGCSQNKTPKPSYTRITANGTLSY